MTTTPPAPVRRYWHYDQEGRMIRPDGTPLHPDNPKDDR